ncbi:MAG TPA: helix-turn-helix domain-containing protein [Streptosporangiaceae bacterium]
MTDPAQITTQVEFGRALTAVRVRAGLTVRQVARAAGLPASTAGDYLSGRHLPAGSQPEPVLKILRACGETEQAALEQWTAALQRARRPPGPTAPGDIPYRGLARFEVSDARWFFGREEVAGRLAALTEGDAGRGLPLVLVGPSGSGKSSLLRAGLTPRLPGPVLIIEPTATPHAALTELLSESALAGPDGPGLDGAGADGAGADKAPAIIVDQFEAVFTRCADEAERRAFIGELCELAGSRLVVLALRADFYGHAVRYPGLARALQFRQVVLGPMTADQVHRAVTEPARLARLEVEDGLVALLLRDLAAGGPDEHAAYEAGALPLLSHAMLATWEHSRGGVLSIAAYLDSGGIRNAVIQTAEDTYARLPAARQDLARRLFLRLVHVSGEAQPSRAAVSLADLRDWGHADAEQVLGAFVGERLITADAARAQITHDSLLVTWPRLRSWIEAGLADLRTERRITEAARAWDGTGRESAALWRGSQLAAAAEWAAEPDRRAALSTLASEFVAASAAADRDRERAARRRTRRLQRLVAALTALVVAVLGLAAYAFQQRQAASTARDDATSRQIAIEAGQVAGQDPPLAAQLGVAAYRIAPTPQAAASVLEASGAPSAARLLDSAGGVQSVSLSPDRALLAVAGADGSLRLWHVASPDRPAPAGRPLVGKNDSPLYTTAFSPDGRILAAAGAGKTISLWDVSRPAHPVRLGQPLTGPAWTVYSVAFSPDGKLLAAGSADRTVRLWNISDPARPVPVGRPLTGAAGYIESVAFSPDGTILAAGSADKTVRLWDVARPAHPVPVGRPLTGPAALVTSVAFSPDGDLLAAASQDFKVWLWKLGRTAGGRPTAVPDGTLPGASDWVNAVAFSPDGTRLAAGTSDASVLVWNLAGRSLAATLPQAQPVTSLAWDGPRALAAGDADGTVSTWHLPSPVLHTGSPAFDAAYSPDGRLLAVSTQAGLQLWNPVTRQRLAARPVAGTLVNAVQFAPSGNILAATYGNGMFQLWRAGRTLTPLSPPLRASARDMVETVAFSPNGRLLATGGDDGTLRLWSVRDPARPVPLAAEPDSGAQVFGVAFAPDGKTVAATSGDDLTRLWNVTSPADPVRLGRPLTGPASTAIAVAFSPRGGMLAVGSADHTVRLWQVTDPAHPVPAGAPLTGPTGYLYGVAFGPGGHTVAAASTDGSVWLWHLPASGRPALTATLTGPAGHVYSVAFSPDGTQLAAASADGSVRLWDTSPAAAAAAVCAGAGQPLTPGEWASYVPGVAYHRPCGP